MTPNIERRGRIARAVTGTLCVAGGVLTAWLAWPESPGMRWTVAGALIAAGAFQWFEAKRGWCVMRACGVRTPM